jgi:hypothetical protein
MDSKIYSMDIRVMDLEKRQIAKKIQPATPGGIMNRMVLLW